MTGMQVPLNTESAQIDAIVTRCGCGDPDSHKGEICPKGIRVNLGTIAYFHRNPLRRLAWELKHKFNQAIEQTIKEQ